MIKLVNRMGAEWRLPPTILFKRIPFAVHVPHQPLVGGDGAVRTGKVTVQPRQFVLEGRIYYPGDRERIRQELEGLLPFLMRPPIEVHHHGRFLRAHPLGAPQDWIDEGAELGLQLPMVALDPYWYGAEETITVVSAAAWVQVDGTAPTPPVVRIEVTTPGADLLLTNTTNGRSLLVAGSYLAGDVVMVYTATYEATLTRSAETVPIVDALGDEFVVRGFELEPDINELTYTGPTANVTLTYRPRWY